LKVTTPNKYEFQKHVRTKFRYSLALSEFTVSLLITCIMAEEIDFEIWSYSQLLDLHDLDLGSGHTPYHCVSLIDLYLITKCHSNKKKNLWDGCKDRHKDRHWQWLY